MRVLVACEFSGIVRNAFVRAGHDAMSCDLLPSETERPDGWDGHYQGDIVELLEDKSYSFDMMIAFPPCTHLAVSGARWFETKQKEQRKAIWFFLRLVRDKIPKIAVENPVGIMSTHYRKPDQIIQPWQFGHGEVKATCLWLKNLPKSEPTKIVSGRKPRVHYASPGPNRWKERSRTLQGIANAMADQWGSLK
jgi:site-specific DNA-cytosine methylase